MRAFVLMMTTFSRHIGGMYASVAASSGRRRRRRRFVLETVVFAR